jgi:hypothetical protein
LGLRRPEIPKGKEIDLRIFRSERIRKLYAQIDGEEMAYCDHYRVENLFHYLRIIVPENTHWI